MNKTVFVPLDLKDIEELRDALRSSSSYAMRAVEDDLDAMAKAVEDKLILAGMGDADARAIALSVRLVEIVLMAACGKSPYRGVGVLQTDAQDRAPQKYKPLPGGDAIAVARQNGLIQASNLAYERALHHREMNEHAYAVVAETIAFQIALKAGRTP